MNIGERFTRLLSRIEPREAELARADRRVAEIRKRLERKFEVRRFAQVGSHWKGTALWQHSDVDVLVVLSRDEARKWAGNSMSSQTLLRRIRGQLQGRYPLTSVHRDGQAIVLPFEQGQHAIDVVPAILETIEQDLINVNYYSRQRQLKFPVCSS